MRPEIPRDLETVCLQCLEKDPAQRYPTAAALAEDLERYLQGQKITRGSMKAWRGPESLWRSLPRLFRFLKPAKKQQAEKSPDA
jgi:hypothetical protein